MSTEILFQGGAGTEQINFPYPELRLSTLTSWLRGRVRLVLIYGGLGMKPSPTYHFLSVGVWLLSTIHCLVGVASPNRRIARKPSPLETLARWRSLRFALTGNP